VTEHQNEAFAKTSLSGSTPSTNKTAFPTKVLYYEDLELWNEMIDGEKTLELVDELDIQEELYEGLFVQTKTQSNSKNRSFTKISSSSEGDICSFCLRVYCDYHGIKKDIIGKVRKNIKRIGIEATRAKYTVVVCVKCKSAKNIDDSVCVKCAGSEVYQICAIGHTQVKNGTFCAKQYPWI